MSWRASNLVLLSCFLLAGCDTDRLQKLEKDNAELKARVEKQSTTSAVAAYDLQAKCAKDARAWFNGNFSRDKDTTFLYFTNHYNTKLNKCFIVTENHFNSHLANPGGESWTNVMSLIDVFENIEYAHLSENHYIYTRPTVRVGDEMIKCEVQGQECKTVDDFNRLTGD